MLRVLLIILSVVAVILAYALGQPLLYVVGLGLIAGAAALTTNKMKKRHADVPESFMKAPEEPEEDLDALGILEIRPKATSGASATRSSPRTDTVDTDTETSGGGSVDPSGRPEGQQVLEFASAEQDADEASSEDAAAVPRPISRTHSTRPTTPVGRSENAASEFVGEVRTKKRRVRIMVAEAAPEQNEDVIIPMLRSLRAGLDACTVCLMSWDDSPVRYHMEAVVSQNSYARGQGSFTANEPLIVGESPLHPVVFSTSGTDGISTKKLGYYHEPIAVRQVGAVLIKPATSEKSYVLVVDTMHEGGLDSESASALLSQYARLLDALLESEARGDLASEKAEKPVTPRREIIASEMQKARSDAEPLALAMVYLNRGEELAESYVGELSEMENQFATRLREVATAGRVEQFGQLTYGVFYRGEFDEVASWASHLQTAFVDAEGHLRGGISVGVALMNARHESPDDLRSDATAALQKAFETGECTIVE